ncbi:cytochrome c biogenesis protein CcsA [Paenibacillus sp. 1781tsa1]|uniref:cytochrome c biogenesis protein CcsA n=1 Tax=Paenibacillus sp. 1781tsa1 TaxID=2953810 RepID=UPI0020A1B51A|nr:cytochrome c biogenesis protein CcsA [Paenibacillus sp. 1781tsa1]MCP1186268.1 cytochrome c biogenesis protein CcsA [Paenibacillus sp. 1781tsa1]
MYALSLLFYFSDCIRRNAGAKRTGTGFLVVVGGLQVTHVILRMWTEGHFPIYTTFDFLFIFSFSIVLMSLVMTRIQRSEFVILLLNVVGFSVTVLNRLWFTAGEISLHNWQTVHGLLIMHITLANLGFAALTVATVFALLYLFLHHKLKKKKWNDTMRRLPSLEVIGKYMDGATLIGTPLLGVSVMLAVLSIVAERRWILLLDLKVIATGLAIAIYVGYFVFKRRKQFSTMIMARWTLIGYGLVIVSFLSNAYSAFHRWTGE